jgi:1-acyl-sn-glycerol-3-phosphate acyltransferase
MLDFEAIRPYEDPEVAGVVARLVEDVELDRAVAVYLMPRLARVWPRLASVLVRAYLRRKTNGLVTVDDVQLFLEKYMARLIEETVVELTVDGLDELSKGKPYLFISNHRDIVMDSGILNYVIHQAGHRTSRIAVGDNLFSRPFAGDLMRLNKSFVVERKVSGTRAVYAALSRTSHYIRQSLEEGESVWIAQREGRSKDGFDRTDPALLKMLGLAYRKEAGSFGDLAARIRIVPVAVSYELDPCDLRKAHELYLTEREGSYTKPPDEDLQSIVEGMTGFKGRVHLHFGAPVTGYFESAEALALEIDRAIVAGLKIFPTQAQAAARLGQAGCHVQLPELPAVTAAFEQRLAGCPDAEKPYLLAAYANVLRNRRELSLPSA